MKNQEIKNAVFESCDLPSFIEKYKDVADEYLLKAIWAYGNRQYNKGFSKGYYDPDYEE